ncbi:MAG: hypothetical protein GMKNLPBB_00890 [Myxococcota bacterium]|nr:hypothetical protein [Myxococcota bacterium]
MKTAVDSVVIDVRPEEFFQIITDFDHYHEFVPEVHKVTTLKKVGNVYTALNQIKLIKDIDYTLELTEDPPHSLRWHLVSSNLMTTNTGSWELKPLDGGAKTHATYTVTISLKLPVPGGIVNSLVQKSLPAMLGNFKARAEGRFRK